MVQVQISQIPINILCVSQQIFSFKTKVSQAIQGDFRKFDSATSS